MSLGEKIAALMERPGQDIVNKEDVPWWMKYAGRGLGTVGSVIAIFLGAWNVVMIFFASIDCFLSGIWQMLAGFLVVAIEAPCCCMFIEYVQTLSNYVDQRPYWNRAAAYCLVAIPPVFLCISLSSLLGCGLIFGTGVIYGMMAVGKKAPLDAMRTAATAQSATNSKSTLVENAQPIGVSSPPDSNV